ncbi:MAG: phosphotransferase [Candidatus Shapirobacteria bacterium]
MTLDQILQQRYNLTSPTQIELIRKGPDNEVFKIITDSKTLVLRLSRRQINNIDFEVEVLSQLYQLGAKVIPPVYTQDNRPYFITDNEQIGTLFPFVSGHHLEVNKDCKPDLKKVALVAQAFADLHQKGQRLHITYSRARTIYTELERILSHEKLFLSSYKDGREFIAKVKEYLYWARSQSSPQGIIHNDYRPNNVFFNQEGIEAILDFDWSCSGFLLKDLGLALAEWSYPDGAEGPWADVFDTFYQSYNSRSSVKYPLDTTLYRWICFACLSDACTYFSDILDNNPPHVPQPINSYMLSKFNFFIKKI